MPPLPPLFEIIFKDVYPCCSNKRLIYCSILYWFVYHIFNHLNWKAALFSRPFVLPDIIVTFILKKTWNDGRWLTGAQHVAGMGMCVCVLLWCSSTPVCLFLQFVVAQDLHRRGPQGGLPALAPGQEGEVTVVSRATRVAITQVSANLKLASGKHDVSFLLTSFWYSWGQFWIFEWT